MDLIKEIIDEHPGTFTLELELIGFGNRKAKEFLSEVCLATMDTARAQNQTQTLNNLLANNARHLLKSINTSAIASRLFINPKLAQQAIKKIEPILARYLSLKTNYADIQP